MSPPSQPPVPRGGSPPEGSTPPAGPIALDATLLVNEKDLQPGGLLPAGDGVKTVDIQPNPMLDQMRKIWRGKWLILAVVVLSLAMAVVKIKRSTPIFSSTAILRVEPKPVQISQYAQIQSSVGSFEDLKTTVDIIKSTAVMERVITALGLFDPSRDDVASEPAPPPSMIARLQDTWHSAVRGFRAFLVPLPEFPEDTAEFQLTRRAQAYLSGVNVKRGEDNFLVYVTYYNPNPEFATLIANTIAEEFIEYIQTLDLQPYTRLREKLESEAQRYSDRIEQGEAEIAAHSIEDPELSLPNALQLAEERLAEAINDLERARRERDGVLEDLRALDEYPDLPIEQILTDRAEAIAKLKTELNATEVQMARVKVDYEDQHPEFRKAQAVVDQARRRLEDERLVAVSTLRAERLRLAARIENLQAAVEKAKQRVRNVHAKQQEIAKLRRSVENDRVFLEDLQQKQREFGVGETIEPSRAVIHERATQPLTPIAPNPRRELLNYLLIGLALGVGLVMLLNYLDRSVHSAFEVEEGARLPTLGFVPHMKLSKAAASDLYRNDESGNAEAFRFLRTSIMYATPDKRPRVLLVTSCTSREGKTTTSINLGVTMARLGARTLLIDCDVKRPSCHQALGLRRKPGLTDYLTGNAPDLDGCIVDTSVKNLQLLPTGSVSPAAADLFESDALNRLLEEVRARYDFVILDSFPLTVGAGTFALSVKADAVALVVVPGQTPRDLLYRHLSRLRALNARVIGGIYNFTTASAEKKTIYTYGYNYVYSYSYRYTGRYGNEKDAFSESDEAVIASGAKSAADREADRVGSARS